MQKISQYYIILQTNLYLLFILDTFLEAKAIYISRYITNNIYSIDPVPQVSSLVPVAHLTSQHVFRYDGYKNKCLGLKPSFKDFYGINCHSAKLSHNCHALLW